jgi:hypothetical protein
LDPHVIEIERTEGEREKIERKIKSLLKSVFSNKLAISKTRAVLLWWWWAIFGDTMAEEVEALAVEWVNKRGMVESDLLSLVDGEAKSDMCFILQDIRVAH